MGTRSLSHLTPFFSQIRPPKAGFSESGPWNASLSRKQHPFLNSTDEAKNNTFISISSPDVSSEFQNEVSEEFTFIHIKFEMPVIFFFVLDCSLGVSPASHTQCAQS